MTSIKAGQKWKYQEPPKVQPVFDVEVTAVTDTHVTFKLANGTQLTLTHETFLEFAKPVPV